MANVPKVFSESFESRAGSVTRGGRKIYQALASISANAQVHTIMPRISSAALDARARARALLMAAGCAAAC
ncbi:hypothetical protein [Erythrobacter litoralis]|uniref:Uncharacterized protein n=1 Tax=Erythrobacter litoralis (strain HTCC2594) TaxID=314225 RepID=Q2N6X8_ERYLH|nr:hypothetical protein [Erythrobacter litoralis]ABC64563.1 hypothetical protein ELI_12355 [Erythrobacter litoralis HTCC2594]